MGRNYLLVRAFDHGNGPCPILDIRSLSVSEGLNERIHPGKGEKRILVKSCPDDCSSRI
jgi:hypothetical protein